MGTSQQVAEGSRKERDLSAAYHRVMNRSEWEDGCLICHYSVASHGYPQAWDGVNVLLAHRVVYEWEHGPIPPGMTVDHTCHTRRCVNIKHLRVLTNLDNSRRNAPGRDWPTGGRCINGHHPSWWRPKGPTRKKGYCHGCRIERQARERGYEAKLDYTEPMAA